MSSVSLSVDIITVDRLARVGWTQKKKRIQTLRQNRHCYRTSLLIRGGVGWGAVSLGLQSSPISDQLFLFRLESLLSRWKRSS